jgi:hypothetical protein
MTYSTVSRLILSYTCLNLLLVGFSIPFHSLKKIASANTLLVAVATTQIFAFVSFPILIHYYQSLFPFLSTSSAMFLHVFIHYIPLLWVYRGFGLFDAGIALLLFGLWYLLVRSIIKKIYTDKISTKIYDSIIIFSSCWYILIVVWINLCSYGCA